MASVRLRRLYQHERKHPSGRIGYEAVDAWSRAKVRLQWDALERLDLVMLQVEADWDFRSDDGNCCCDDPMCSAKTGPAYGLVSQYRISDRSAWQQGASVWGITGEDDPIQGHCAPDIMSETLDAFKAARKDHLRRVRDRRAGLCTTCHGSGRLQSA
jgi:hypothetical protein